MSELLSVPESPAFKKSVDVQAVLSELQRRHALERIGAVSRAEETKDYAALLVEVYGGALADAMRKLYGESHSSKVTKECEAWIGRIDPNWKRNKLLRQIFPRGLALPSNSVSTF